MRIRNAIGAPCHLLYCLCLAMGCLSLISPWHSSSTQACPRLCNNFSPCTHPSQRLPQEVWGRRMYSGQGAWVPLVMTCLAVAHSTVCSLEPSPLKGWTFCDCPVLPGFNFVRYRQLRTQQLLSCDDGRDCKTNWSNCFKTSWGFRLT